MSIELSDPPTVKYVLLIEDRFGRPGQREVSPLWYVDQSGQLVQEPEERTRRRAETLASKLKDWGYRIVDQRIEKENSESEVQNVPGS